MSTDLISDLLTRIRNALLVRHSDVKIRCFRVGGMILDILKIHGFIIDYYRENDDFIIKLKYDPFGLPVIEGINRVSKPGLRVYVNKNNIPSIQGGLGVAIISTSRGLMTGNSAKKQGIGGEVICRVW